MRSLTILTLLFILVTGTVAAGEPARSAAPGAVWHPLPDGKSMAEGFEGAWLPAGWSHVQTNPDSLSTWHHADFYSAPPYEGSGLARVRYTQNSPPQDEKLGFDYGVASDDVLAFALSASTYWTSNYSLFVEIDGESVWDFATDGNGANFEYEVYHVDLSAHAGSTIHIDFRYLGLDGADVYLDAVAVGEFAMPATLTGHVTDGGSSLEGVRVQGYDGSSTRVFDVPTDALGDYNARVQLPAGDYTVAFDLFGHAHFETVTTLVEGPNVLDATLTADPTGDVTGVVTAAGDSSPLEAFIIVRREDTDELIAQTVADPDGAYTLAGLPHFTYEIFASAYGYVTESALVTVDGAEIQNFALDNASAVVLLIDDSTPARPAPDKLDGKGEVIAGGYVSSDRSVVDLATDFSRLGYGTVVETMATTDPASWSGYDILVVACGDNAYTLLDSDFRDALVPYARAGGKVLFEGGEIAFNWYYDPDMAGILHISDWMRDSGGDVSAADPGHSVMSTPNAIADTLSVSYSVYGDQDAVLLEDPGVGHAVMAGLWTEYPDEASVVCWSIDGHEASGNSVYFAFDYSEADSARINLLENAAAWLTTPSPVLPIASIGGTATLEGAADHSGVLVELGTGPTVTTDADGAFAFTGLYGGTYTLTASREGYDPDTLQVVLADEEALTDADLDLPLYVEPATLTGNVTDASAPAPDVIVRGYDATPKLLFDVVTDEYGDYDAGIGIEPAEITVVFDKFGYLEHEYDVALIPGANVLDHALVLSPMSEVAGTVTAAPGGEPLEAIVSARYVYDDEPAVQDTCGVDGTYEFSVPHEAYIVTAVHPGYVSELVVLHLTGPTIRDFALEPSEGSVLVINNSPDKRAVPDKLDGKGRKIADGHVVDRGSAFSLIDDLATLGFGTVLEYMTRTDPLSWPGYEFVVVACGNNPSTLHVAGFRADLTAYAGAGGKLLIEGGEVGYDWRNDPDMKATLHIDGWQTDSAGDVGVADPGHPVMSTPNAITGPLPLDYTGYADSDAMIAAPDAEMAGNWTNHGTRASVICWSADADPSTGNTVYFSFNYDRLDATRIDLLENAATWLTHVSVVVPTASISGTATLAGATEHAGVTVELSTGASVMTGVDGAWSFADLYADTYMITARKDGYATGSIEATVAHEQQLTGVELALDLAHTDCRAPALPIPDDDPAGVADVLSLSAPQAVITSLSVYLDITHTCRGDLLVRLTSPEGTTVTLHARSGGPADDLVGWYPAELVPAGDLGAFAGEPLSGDWTLFVADELMLDSGTLNSWCLSAGHFIDPALETPDIPAVYALHDNYPNPFNPTTTIEFSLPVPGHVELRIFDVAGRMILALVDGEMGAATHAVAWNGRDRSGRSVASGVYYYRLVTDGLTATRKMVLVR